jgi:hypothetical protein
MIKHVQTHWVDRWQAVASNGSGRDCAGISAQWDAPLQMEGVPPLLNGLPDAPVPFLPWYLAEQAA